jgi:hypothetical protein
MLFLLLFCSIVLPVLSFDVFNWTRDDLGLSKYRSRLTNPFLPGLLPKPTSNSIPKNNPIAKPPKSYARIIKEKMAKTSDQSPPQTGGLFHPTIWTPKVEDNVRVKRLGKP